MYPNWCALQCKCLKKSLSEKLTSFYKNFAAPEGAISHNVLYYQQLSIAHYQVSLYANNLPIVSSALKGLNSFQHNSF